MTAALVIGLGIGWNAHGQQTLPYKTGFEADEGFKPGDLGGQDGWSIDQGAAEISLGVGENATQGLRIKPSRPFGQVSLGIDSLEVDAGDSIVFSDFHVKPVATSNEDDAQFVDAEGAIAGFFKIDREGELFVLNGHGAKGGEWIPTGARFMTSIDGRQTPKWIHLTLRQDFQAKVWDLYINGEVSTANLGLWTDDVETLRRFSLMGHSQYPLDFDNLTISTENVAFEDADRDGMPDAWEEQLGEFHDRDDDPDGDDLTNIEELVLGTNPVEANSQVVQNPISAESAESAESAGESGDQPRQSTESTSGRAGDAQVKALSARLDGKTLKTVEQQIIWERGRRARYAFPSDVTEDALIDAPYLLAPFHKTAEPTESDRRRVAAALSKYYNSTGLERTEALEQYVKQHPDSPFALWIDVCVAPAQWNGGRYSLALANLERISRETPPSAETAPLRDLAQAKLARCYSKLGRKKELQKLMGDLRLRTLAANVEWDVSQARMGLVAMTNHSDVAFNCGSFALQSIRKYTEGKGRDAESLKIKQARSAQRGFSLKEVADLAKEVGMNYRMVRKRDRAEDDLAVPVPVPSVVHWKSRHFAAIIAKVGDDFLVKDPTFDSNVVLTKEAINEESSGRFLIPDSEFDASVWEPVALKEAEQTIGMGIPVGFYTTTGCDTDCGSRGLPSYGFNMHHGSYVISDTPIWVPSALGFDIEFSVRHRSYSPGVSGLNLGTNNWSVSWGDKITYDTWTATVVSGTGHQSVWNLGSTISGVTHYTHPTKTATLTRTGAAGSYVFTYTELDGSKRIFSHWSGGGFLFLSEVHDNAGKNITITHEVWSTSGGYNSYRPKEITDPFGHGLKLVYVSSSGTGKFQVKEVQDAKNPARKAVFTYTNSGVYRHLSRITDAQGLWADFTYSPQIEWIQWNGQPNFTNGATIAFAVKEMKTASPTSAGYVTKFHPLRGAFDPNSDFTRFGSHVEDPEGFEERVLFGDYFKESHKVPGADYTTTTHGFPPAQYDDAYAKGYETPSPNIAGPLRTSLLNMGCTFYWGKKAMHNNPPNDASGANYDKSVHTVWLREDSPYSVTAVPSSRRDSESHRTFFHYPGQGSFVFEVGTSSQPDVVARTVLSESNVLSTQSTEFEYHDQANPGVTPQMHDKIKMITDPKDRETHFGFDGNGRLSTVLLVSPSSTPIQQIDYTGNGTHTLPNWVKDAGGNKTYFSYDSHNRLKQTWITVNGSTEKTYFDFHPGNGFLQKIRRTDPDNPYGTVTLMEVTEFDAFFRPKKVVNADGYEITQHYDNLNRVTQVTHPDSTTETLGYTRGGVSYLDLQTYTDRENKTTDMIYNGNRQLVEVQDAANGSTKFGWCSCGDLEWLMDPKQSAANPGFDGHGVPTGGHTRWHRDALGRVTSKVYADGKTIGYTYQPESGLLSTVSYPNDSGATMTFKYYKDGNLQKIDYTASNTPDVTFWYDPQYNRMTKRLDGSGYSYFYYHPIDGTTDGGGQLRYINGPLSWDSTHYNYDDLGRVDNRYINTPSSYSDIRHNVTSTFDSLGRLTNLNTGIGTFGFDYIEHAGNKETDLLKHVNYPNGQQTRFAYTPTGRFLSKITNDRDASTGGLGILSEHTYTHTGSGQIETWRRNAPGLYDKTFTMTASGSYDNLYQLKKVNDSGLLYDYTYDTAGNRTKRKVGATTYDHGAANARNQLTGYGMTYDNSGNLLTQTDPETGAKYAYVWDSINRLLEIKVDKNGDGSYGIGDSKTVFAYDGLSRRYRQKDYIRSGGSWSLSQTTHFLWCGGEICQKRVGGTSYSSVRANYYGSGESRHTSHTNKTSHFYTKDHLGSIREVTSGSGSSITMNTAFDYSPYGVRTYAPNPGGSDPWKAEFGYTGHFFHAPSGTHLAWFRGYDPRIGRWLNVDPIGEHVNTHGNLYLYGPNWPFSSYDEHGGVASLLINGGIAVWDEIQFRRGKICLAERNVRHSLTALALAADVATGGMGGGLAVRGASVAARTAQVGVNLGSRRVAGAAVNAAGHLAMANTGKSGRNTSKTHTPGRGHNHKSAPAKQRRFQAKKKKAAQCAREAYEAALKKWNSLTDEQRALLPELDPQNFKP